MSKRANTIAIVLSLIGICLASVSLIHSIYRSTHAQSETQAQVETQTEAQSQAAEAQEEDVQYVMYIGTNDKDTDIPVCTPEEAMALVKEVLIKHLGGYTLQDSYGGWKGDNGMVYEEYSVVAYISDAEKSDIYAAADELIERLNQSSILIQTNPTRTEFYSGANS